MKTYYVIYHYYWNLCWDEFTDIRKALRYIKAQSKDKAIIDGAITLKEEDSRVEYKFVNGKRVR